MVPWTSCPDPPTSLPRKMHQFPLRLQVLSKNSSNKNFLDHHLKVMRSRYQENSSEHLRCTKKPLGFNGPVLVLSASLGKTPGILWWVSLIFCQLHNANGGKN